MSDDTGRGAGDDHAGRVPDPARGRGSGRGGRRGRGGRYSRNSHIRAKFKGNTEAMNGNVFQCYGESPDKQQFTKTLEALAGHINKTMDFPKDLASICKKMQLDTVVEPVDLSEEEAKSATKRLIWKTKV